MVLVLLGAFFVLKAWSYALDRFLLLYGDNGVVVGAGYTEHPCRTPGLWVLIGLAVTAAVASWVNIAGGTDRILPPRWCWLRAHRSCLH